MNTQKQPAAPTIIGQFTLPQLATDKFFIGSFVLVTTEDHGYAVCYSGEEVYNGKSLVKANMFFGDYCKSALDNYNAGLAYIEINETVTFGSTSETFGYTEILVNGKLWGYKKKLNSYGSFEVFKGHPTTSLTLISTNSSSYYVKCSVMDYVRTHAE